VLRVIDSITIEVMLDGRSAEVRMKVQGGIVTV
jgi:hypothetical protein